MRRAIVHERFTELGGSERVVEQLHALWPEAPIYAAVIDPVAVPPGLRDADLRPSRLQRFYRGGTKYAHLLPLIPGAIAALDLDDFDLVITSHHAFANRVQPPDRVPVISYTHTPARWMWDAEGRRGERGGFIGRFALGAFSATQRRPDRFAAQRLLGIIANSRAVAARVEGWWGRNATVITPPVDIEKFTPGPVEREDFYLLAGRLVPYKEPLVAVQAAQRAGVRLVVVGDGRLRKTLEHAAGPDTEIVGAVDDDTLRDYYRRCRALVFPGREDFGIVPVEAQACGAPVVALGTDGVLDSVLDGVTGSLYPPGPDPVLALAGALEAFDPDRFDPEAIRRHAENFAPGRFCEQIDREVTAMLAR